MTCRFLHDHFNKTLDHVDNKKDTLSRVAVFGEKHKRDRCSYQFNERNMYHPFRAVLLTSAQPAELVEEEKTCPPTRLVANRGVLSSILNDEKILGNWDVFVMGDHHQNDYSQLLIPREIFHWIMLFIPAFPYYFMLRSVCRQWLFEFEQHIYAKVEHLSLVDDGKPKYYFSRDSVGRETLVQFKPIGSIETERRLSDDFDDHCDKTHLFKFLTESFPNVTHLRLGYCSLNFTHFAHCVLPLRLNRLETLDIVGTVNRRHRDFERSTREKFMWGMLVRLFPRSTKNLNFIGVDWCNVDALSIFKMIKEQLPSLQHFSLPYLFLDQDQLSDDDWEAIKEMYHNFEVSVVVESANYDHHSTLPVIVSYVDYLNYMSKKEGVVLSHMRQLKRDTDEIMEAVIDSVVREYPTFQPLVALSFPTQKEIAFASHTRLDAEFVVDSEHRAILPRILELLTSPSRMKYAELVFNIDSTFLEGNNCTPSTLLGRLISQCSNEQELNVIKRIIETYKPSMAVNGVRNYLVEAIGNTFQMDVMKYLLSLKPEMITLGDLDGIINDDQRDLPLIQLFLKCQDDLPEEECLEDVKYLVSAGVSLMQVDKDGNNVFHSACRLVNIDLVEYLVALCPEHLIFERNNLDQTPIEHIFLNLRGIHVPIQKKFLEQVIKLPFFRNHTLQDYTTSFGTLLHASMARPNQYTIRWLLKSGFDVNALNKRGENTLLHYAIRSNQIPYRDPIVVELINAGAQVDCENNEGETILSSALRNNHYTLINILVQTASVSSKQWSTLLAPRMKHGLNALHYLVNKMVEILDSYAFNQKAELLLSDYPIAKHCALLCLGHHPEMLYERSEPSKEENLKDICGVSPLQMLLEARHTLHLLNDLAIKLSDIANQPVFKSKNTGDEIAPIPVMYLASEVALDIPLFDQLMSYTHNVLISDETRETKPNLLHIAAERSPSLCECIINHWKERYPNPDGLSLVINQPLKDDDVDRKPRTASTIAWSSGFYEIVLMLAAYNNTDSGDNTVTMEGRQSKRRRTEP